MGVRSGSCDGLGRATRHRVLALTLLVSVGCGSSGPAESDGGVADAPALPDRDDPGARALDGDLVALMRRAGYPGMQVAVTGRGAVRFVGAYGVASAVTREALGVDHVFYVASVAKTVTAVALMQQMEAGRAALDEDINARGNLGFRVANPQHPGAAITYRQLFTHTSSLRDRAVIDEQVTEGDNTALTLADFLAGYLVPGGRFHGPGVFAPAAPGRSAAYSNAGVALMGLLAQQLAGTPFDEYCEARLFRPLGMARTSWRLRGLPPGARLATGHRAEGGALLPLPRYGQDPAYPSGALQSTAADLARFLAGFANDGELAGARFLAADAVTTMRTMQTVPGDPIGLVWFFRARGGVALVGHDGSYGGFRSEMWFRPDTGAGALFLANAGGEAAGAEDVPAAIIDRLLREADRP